MADFTSDDPAMVVAIFLASAVLLGAFDDHFDQLGSALTVGSDAAGQEPADVVQRFLERLAVFVGYLRLCRPRRWP